MNEATKDRIRALVGVAVGEGSVCWSQIDRAGVFDDAHAAFVVERTVMAIVEAIAEPDDTDRVIVDVETPAWSARAGDRRR